MKEVEDRKRLLEKLIRLEGPLGKTIEALEGYDFNTVDGEELVVLDRRGVIDVLERYLRSEVSAEEVYNWADALELREDVSFGRSGDESGDVFDAIYHIATPEFEGKMTLEKARELIERLGG